MGPSILRVVVTTLLLATYAGTLNAQDLKVGRGHAYGGHNFTFETEMPVTVDTIDVPVAQAWIAIDRAYRKVGFNPKVLREGMFTFGMPMTSMRKSIGKTPLSRYINCGEGAMGMPNSDHYSVRLSVVSQLAKLDDNRSVITTQLAGTADPQGLGIGAMACNTKTVLEKKIARAVEQVAKEIREEPATP